MCRSSILLYISRRVLFYSLLHWYAWKCSQLFLLGVFLFSCPRRVFAVFISALFPTFFTALLAPSRWVLCDGKEPWESSPVGSAVQGRFCGSGSLSWALGQRNSLGKVQHEGTLWLHASLVLASTCALSLGFNLEHKPCGAFANHELVQVGTSR